MEYVITVTKITQQHPRGEFVFRTSFSNRSETYNVYHILRHFLPYDYQLYVDRWEKTGTDMTDEFKE